MALLLKTEHKGIIADYWKIIKTSEDYSENNIIPQTVIRIGLYKDAKTRQENIDNYLYLKAIIIDKVDLKRNDIYSIIKELDDFKEAKDC